MDQGIKKGVNYSQNMGHINRAGFIMGPNAQSPLPPQNIEIL